MPMPPHEMDNPMSLIYNYFLPMFALLAFMLIFPSVLKRLIEEKCSGIKVKIYVIKKNIYNKNLCFNRN